MLAGLYLRGRWCCLADEFAVVMMKNEYEEGFTYTVGVVIGPHLFDHVRSTWKMLEILVDHLQSVNLALHLSCKH